MASHPAQSDATGDGLTQRVAAFASLTRWEDIPDRVRHEAKRSLLNSFATALGGCREPAIAKSMAVLAPFSGAPTCSLIGRPERADMLLAAYINAMSANIFDFDDTHPATVIHPTAPVAPALFALAEVRRCNGAQLLRAFVIGAEIECRLGNAVSPYHYRRGWHITSTCGVVGAAIGAGVLTGLGKTELGFAIGNATAQACGLVETLGTMSKSISVGNAARNGLASALLAAEGFSGPAGPLEGTHGFLAVYADGAKPAALTAGLGEHWEFGGNTYKPYPVGVVLNPVMEACLGLHAKGGVRIEDVTGVELTGNPFLQQRTNRPHVATGRESQVSAQHAIAIALRRGRAGIAEFSDDAVAETARDGIRPVVTYVDDESCDIESVRMVVRTRSSGTHRLEIKDTRGGSCNPLSDGDLEAKLTALADYGGFRGDVKALARSIWELDRTDDAAGPAQLARGV